MNIHSPNFRDLAAAEFDTTTLLAHAAEQAAARRYEDFCIVDVDCHHYETEAFQEIIQYMDDPVLRHEAKYQGMARPGIASADGSYQELGGRITRYPGRRIEKVPPAPHRDITLMRRWMDAMGVDIACMFPTPMLNLAACPRVEVEVALAQRLQPLALREDSRRGVALQVDALPAVQRSRGLLQDRAGIRRQARASSASW